jgi:hypothetical protein
MATAIQKLNGEANRLQVMNLRLAGHTLWETADKLGMTEAGVRYHQEAWLAEQKPSAEQTEELRQMQAAQIDSLTTKLSHVVDRPVFDEDGNVLLHPVTGEPVKTADVQVVDRLVKLMDRKARLMGLDLATQTSITLNVTAEGLAAALGFDDSVIDVEAVEQPALEEGE